MQRRVVITGLGLVSPFGIGKDIFWNSLVEGKSAIRRLTRFDPTGYDCQIAGEIPDDSYKDLIDLKHRKRMTNVAQLAVAGASLALGDAQLRPPWPSPYSSGVIIGTSIGNLKDGVEQQSILLERGANRINPFVTLSLHVNSLSAEVAIATQARGITFTISGGCASSLGAIGVATNMIQNGTLDVCLTGGSESPLFPLTFASLSRTKELTTQNDSPHQASRPFDRAHDGMVVSEGSCILILEELTHAEKRGAPIYAEVLGYALGSEAYDSFVLESSGESAAHTLRGMLARTQVLPDEIDWINAHGSSCPDWDRKETLILKKSLGQAVYKIPISATKSMTGHSFGAASSFQVASTILAMQHSTIPPTINLDTPDPECDLDYVPHRARSLDVHLCLINSFAYGGINSFLLLKKYQ